VVFVYDQAGHLLGEYDQNGAALREYVWLRDTPMAMFTPDPANPSGEPLVYFIHTDHLNTPRVVVDRQNRVRWRWLAEPFGTSAPETDPSGLGGFTQNLRFPGQYADAESGLFYNYHRYYAAGGGGYTQSDPIGLAGGINTFAYVSANPLSLADPSGLAPDVRICVNGVCPPPPPVWNPDSPRPAPPSLPDLTKPSPLLPTWNWDGITWPSWMAAKPPRSTDPQADIDHKAYKDEYDKKPPPGLDPCEFLKWKLAREKAVMGARMAFDAKYGQPWHTQPIADGARAIKKIEDQIKNTPGCTCP
jgi:RHS repeat-associated protein